MRLRLLRRILVIKTRPMRTCAGLVDIDGYRAANIVVVERT